MSALGAIDVVVFDVLGTMVDERAGLRAAIRDASPASDDAAVEGLLATWQDHVEGEQRRIAQGVRPYANSDAIDAEAAARVAAGAGITEPGTIARLGAAGHRLPAWGDAVGGLDRLAGRLPVLGLSNAGGAALLRLNAHAGLRWHQALSGELVGVYKPAPEVYELVLAAAGCPPERVLMVAAHAWDLRGAQRMGMCTAYVQRPVGDRPLGSDDFDWHFDGLAALVAAMTADA